MEVPFLTEIQFFFLSPADKWFAFASDQSSLPYANINNTWNYNSTFFILSYYTINTYIRPDVGKQE